MNPITAFFEFISAPITQWVKNRGEIATAKHNLKKAVIDNKARLASDKESHNHEWEMASLENQDTSLRWCSFMLFALPIIITIVAPTYGAVIWTNLELVPPWFVTVFVSMIGGIWGLAELKKGVPQIVSAIKKK